MDVLQTLGLEYAKHQEISYGLPLAILMVAACFVYKVSKSGGSTADCVVVGAIALATFLQVPAVIAQAESQCRTQLSEQFPDDLSKAQLCREQFPDLDREQFPDLDRENPGPLNAPPQLHES